MPLEVNALENELRPVQNAAAAAETANAPVATPPDAVKTKCCAIAETPEVLRSEAVVTRLLPALSTQPAAIMEK